MSEINILLMGDSTTEGSIPRLVEKTSPQFEDLCRLLLAAEEDITPVNIHNIGLSGETIHQFLESGRYFREIAKFTGLNYIFIRYGINDQAKRESFETNFPKDYHQLLDQLGKDQLQAMLIPATIIPFLDPVRSKTVNDLIGQVARERGLKLFDVYPRYAAELERGGTMLNYRRFPLDKIPKKYRSFVGPYVMGDPPQVIVLDNRLDAHFGGLPGWYDDAHPNLAGYHVIADETVKFLAPIIRENDGVKIKSPPI